MASVPLEGGVAAVLLGRRGGRLEVPGILEDDAGTHRLGLAVDIEAVDAGTHVNRELDRGARPAP